MSETLPRFFGLSPDAPEPEPLPPIETDGSYLDEDWLDALREYRFRPQDAAKFLVTTFVEAVAAMAPYCSVRITNARNHGIRAKRVRFATGGWSGAEALIDATLDHMWIRDLHTEWKTGGLFIFVVPDWQINGKSGPRGYED